MKQEQAITQAITEQLRQKGIQTRVIIKTSTADSMTLEITIFNNITIVIYLKMLLKNEGRMEMKLISEDGIIDIIDMQIILKVLNYIKCKY
ncbi:MAG: hypothetical protein EOM76_01690 [Sphingobacteriia bacterium]|jgi:hypothetical protein|nr:hypothetical protein [Paludibacteraceae bacterium]NCA78891.1 hypothetical protein [Sphingobacteriia bacterium]